MMQRRLTLSGNSCKKGYEIGRTVAGKPVCVSTGKSHEVSIRSVGRGRNVTDFVIEDPSLPEDKRFQSYTARGTSVAARRRRAFEEHARKFSIIKPIKGIDFAKRIRRQGEKEVGVPKAAQTGRDIKVAGRTGPISVKVLERHGVYAVHRQDDDRKRYNVTHVPTGMALKQGLTRSKAGDFAKYLHGNAPGAAAGAKFGKMPDLSSPDVRRLRDAVLAWKRGR
jgi:hypothetical protein